MDTNNGNGQKPKLEEAGALWKRTSKSGNTYLNGTVKTKDGQAISVLIFSNSNKVEGSNQPDYRVYFDTPRGDAPVAQTKSAPKATKQNEDIPF